MNKLQRQVLSVLTLGLLVTNSVSAATTLTITGNGSDSNNNVSVNQAQTTSVVQSNNAVITNAINTSADSGDNEANDNTGGDVVVKTGKATAETTVTNAVNSNTADVDCCADSDVELKISGNGTNSDNNLTFSDSKSGTQLFQENNAVVTNAIETEAETGENEANGNTGGDVRVTTGNAEATTEVSTVANVNHAWVGGNGSDHGSLSAVIEGNGSESDNNISLEMGSETAIVQENMAVVTNAIENEAETGDNEAKDNTSGEVHITTGDATADVTVDNMVNFNAADVDCGCLLDVEAKVANNGTDSDNNLTAELGGGLSVYQGGEQGAGNNALLTNGVENEAETGENDAEFNTGSVEGDPSITTGAAESTTEVSNSGNQNVYGVDADWEMPEVDFNFNVSLSLSQLLGFLGL